MRRETAILAVAMVVMITGCGANNSADTGSTVASAAADSGESVIVSAEAADTALSGNVDTHEKAVSFAEGTEGASSSDSEAGRSSGESGTTASDGGTMSSESEQTTSKADISDTAAMAQYRNVLDHTDTLKPFVDYAEPTGTYYYSLVTMKEGEGPSLLLAQEQEFGTDYVRIYYYDPETETRYATTNDVITFGVAGVGGFRGSLDVEPDGNGLRLQTWGANNPEVDVVRYTRDGNKLVGEAQGSYSLLDEDSGQEDGEEIEWYDLSDTRALDSWPKKVLAAGTGAAGSSSAGSAANTAGKSDAASGSGESSSAGKSGTSDSASSGKSDDSDSTDAKESSTSYQNGDVLSDGRTVLTGTMRVLDYQEVCDLQGISYPNPGSEVYETSPYGIFVLDTPMTLTFDSVDGPYAGEVEMIGTDSDLASQYNGKHVTVSVGSSDGSWPSDTSLPLGEPRAALNILN